MTPNLDELYETAKAADKASPQFWLNNIHRKEVYGSHESYPLERKSEEICKCHSFEVGDFIAAFSPSVAIRLIERLRELEGAIKPVITEADQKADWRHDSWNPDAHVELTLTIAEIRALARMAIKTSTPINEGIL